MEEEYENIDKCKSDDDCVDDPNGHNKCFPSGACGSIQALNDLCDDEIEICEEGLECVLGICSERVGEGEACNDYEAVLCPDSGVSNRYFILYVNFHIKSTFCS